MARRARGAERPSAQTGKAGTAIAGGIKCTVTVIRVIRDRSRVRAYLDSECPALDFYGGFYLQPDDERICAKREFVRSRVGGSCRIERFQSLKPQVKR